MKVLAGWLLLALTITSCGQGSLAGRPTAAPTTSAGTKHEGPTSPLYVTNGTKVEGGGYIVALDGKVRLCGGDKIYDAGFPEGPPAQCSKGVDLQDFDTSLLRKVDGGRAGNASFVGVWQADTVKVTASSPSRQEHRGGGRLMDDAVVPCPEPAGGWPPKAFAQEDYPAALLQHRKSYPHDAMVTAILYPKGELQHDVQVLGVVTPDKAAAERVRSALDSSHGKALCVVVADYTPEEFALAAQGADGVYAVREPGLETGLKLFVNWSAFAVNDEVQSALDKLPAGLVEVTSLVRPVR
jgi:hypothetical protein